MIGEQRLDELDPVVEQQRDAIVCLHAARRENRREACRAIVDLGVSSNLVAGRHGRLVRTGPACPTGELRQHQPA